MRRIAVISSALLFAMFLVSLAVAGQAAAQESDTEIIQKLALGSPWNGKWSVDNYSGTVSFKFWEDKGRLKGELLDTSALSFSSARVGALKWVEVKNGKVTFTAPSGTTYELTLTKEGRLKGKIVSGTGATSGHEGSVELNPKTQ